jgi:hypothetical protein
MQLGNSQPNLQSNQPQLQTQQHQFRPRPDQFQNLSSPPNNVPPKKDGNWFRTRSSKTKLGFGLIVIALLLCIFAVYEFGSAIGAPRTNSAVNNAGNSLTAVGPRATNTSTLPQAQNAGVAILGAPLSTFTAKFGQSNDHSSPGQMHLARCKGSNTDQLILARLSLGTPTQPVTSILYASCSTWTVTTAESLCSKFFPADAVYQKTITIPGSPNNFPALDKIYYSATLAHEFSAATFIDAHKNLVKPGLFDVNYLYETMNDTTHMGSCNVQLGTQQSG